MMSHDHGLPSTIRGFTQDPNPNPNPSKRKRNLPGTPDPDAEVIALSPKSLMATNRFICEVCKKGFQREQNLQLHRRGHNLPWKLKQRSSNLEVVRKKVYVCPEKTCVHHDPCRALGDLTGIKKHYSRKHGEKKWKCEKCSKKYAVQSDWKAHSKICGTREYKCDCGTLFSRKDSFITHRAFCDALAEENARFSTPIPSANLSFKNETMINMGLNNLQNGEIPHFSGFFKPEIAGLESRNQLNLDLQKSRLPIWLDNANSHLNPSSSRANFLASNSTNFPAELVQIAAQNQWLNGAENESYSDSNINASSSVFTEINSATALLQKAAEMGSTNSAVLSNGFGLVNSSFSNDSFSQNRNEGHQNIMPNYSKKQSRIEGETRDFLGVNGMRENRRLLQEFAAMSSTMEMGHYSRNH